MATYLTRTPSAGSHGHTWTISFWFKNTCAVETQEQYLYMGGDGGTSNNMWIRVNGTSRQLYLRNRSGGSNNTVLTTNRVFRDTNAWYHIVYAFDGNNSTEGDRVRLYVNGVRETSFSSATYPSQGTGFYIGATGDPMNIGRRNDGSGYNDVKVAMAHFHIVDGTAYNADTFGETDSTTGIWKPKTAPSVTYGTNGCFLKFENSSSMGTDSSGQGNNFTVNGTITQLIDTPSNVFATMNPLMDALSEHTFSNGNNTVQSPNSTHSYVMSTLGFSKGKYYFETKCEAKSGGSDWFMVGITAKFPTADNAEIGNYVTDHGYRGDNGNHRNNNSESSYGSTFGVGDIIGCAVDMDNGKLYFHKNGTYQNSGVPTSGSTGTGAINISSASSPPTADGATGFYFPSVAFWDSTYNGTLSVNFGNGYFGTTAVSSAQNPDDGIGIFEYDVPAGYRALCTKSINAQEYS